ncbi:MAG: hypothetical protein EA424_28605 [Planctomycetaceae bacterium]|nr:MAG: hypothetical protein EA424_28605 [Planctomycetaceae bacterium]
MSKLGLPAGVGMATARACLKLWLGFPPKRSGVDSAGNGPAMGKAVLGRLMASGSAIPVSTGKQIWGSSRPKIIQSSM